MFRSCDFNKYTIRVIKKMAEAKIKDEVETENADEDMMLVKSNDSDSDENMIDDDTSEE